MTRARTSCLAVIALACTAAAQDCPGEWASGFELRGAGGVVDSMELFDDGNGPALYAGGSFYTMGAADATNIARWNGQKWSPVGGSVYGGIDALCTFDDGNGPSLYAAGRFSLTPGGPDSFLSKFSDAGWQSLIDDIDGGIEALAVFDADGDGPGAPALYAGGDFTHLGAVNVNDVARWDGQKWSPLGNGTNGYVQALAVFDDDGPGPAKPILYVGGRFTRVGVVETNGLAKWNGANWSAPIGGGVDDDARVVALLPVDGRAGLPRQLLVGGDFGSIGGVDAENIARWDGTGWAALGAGTNDDVVALEIYDSDGAGPQPAEVYAGGGFTKAGNVNASGIARWNGQAWSGLGIGVVGSVWALKSCDLDGDGTPTLHVGGSFRRAGLTVAQSIACWNGAKWSVTDGTNGTQEAIDALAEFDDGTGGGRAVYAGGTFYAAGDKTVLGIGRYTGQGWETVGGLTGWGGPWAYEVNELIVFDDIVSGPGLYAGGAFTEIDGIPAASIARLDASGWSPVGGGIGGLVFSLAIHDDGSGPALYAGGDIVEAGGKPAKNVVRWDGSVWTTLGDGLNHNVSALASYDDDGPGPKPATLYAGGNFILSGDKSVRRIARWDGQTWSPLGIGADDDVRSLASFDPDADGPARPLLIVGGQFDHVGAVSTHRIAAWNGSNWLDIAKGGLYGGEPGHTWILSMAVRDDDGPGPADPALYVCGGFTTIAGVPARSIARWDGEQWSALGAGMGKQGVDYSGIRALVSADHVAQPGLYVGGWFYWAGSIPSANIARWACEPALCAADLNGDGAIDLFDFLAFTNLFNDGDARADCDNSGGLDLFDFLCFTNTFNAGC